MHLQHTQHRTTPFALDTGTTSDTGDTDTT